MKQGIDRITSFRAVATTLIVATGAAMGYAAVSTQPRLLADEGFHAPQVWAFVVGRFEILQGTTMLPTYHAILAMVERAVVRHDVALLRFLNLLGSLLLPILVWRLVAMHHPGEAGRRTVQWFLMPLLFPFFFLVYTDVWALVAVLATQFCALRRWYLLAGLAGLAAILLRQDMVIWVAAAWMLVLFDALDPRQRREAWRERFVPAFFRGLPLLAVLISFLVFYVWNGGVAVGDRHLHQAGFNLTNVAYFLLCAWAIFLPQNLQAVGAIRRLLRKPACIGLLIAGFVLYMSTYANTHQFNSAGLRFYLHNEGLYWLTQYTGIRAIAFAPMAWMVLTVCALRGADPRLHVLYLIAPLSVGLHPLIEPRYYLPALTLFQVWRPPAHGRTETAMLIIYAIATPIIMWGIVTLRFFP